MSNLQKAIAIIVYTLIIASGAYFLSPSKTVTVTKTEIKEVIKEVEKTNSHTKTIVRTHKDGTSTTITVADNSTSTTTDTDLDTKTETTKEVTRSSSGPTIAVLGGLNVTRPVDGYFFAGQISFPVHILPVSLILQASTNKTAMVGLSLKLP